MRVILADQDSAMIEATALALRDEFPLDVVTSKAHALDLLRQNDIHVLVACERLADGSGLDLLSQASRRWPETLRIFCAEPERLRMLSGHLRPFQLFQTLAYPVDPQQLRSLLTLAQAVEAANADTGSVTHIVLGADGVEEEEEDDAEPEPAETPALRLVNARGAVAVAAAPARAPAAAPRVAAAPAAALQQRVVVLSRDRACIEAASGALAGTSLAVTPVNDGEAALRALASLGTAAMLVDVGALSGDPGRFLTQAHGLAGRSSIIAVGRRDDVARLQPLVARGVLRHVLVKPLDPEATRAVLQVSLEAGAVGATAAFRERSRPLAARELAAVPMPPMRRRATDAVEPPRSRRSRRLMIAGGFAAGVGVLVVTLILLWPAPDASAPVAARTTPPAGASSAESAGTAEPRAADTGTTAARLADPAPERVETADTPARLVEPAPPPAIQSGVAGTSAPAPADLAPPAVDPTGVARDEPPAGLVDLAGAAGPDRLPAASLASTSPTEVATPPLAASTFGGRTVEETAFGEPSPDAQTATPASAESAGAATFAATASPSAAGTSEAGRPRMASEVTFPPVVVEHRLIRQVPPDYPESALRSRTEGAVELAFTVAEDGTVRDVEVVSATPPGVFERAAIAAVRRWRYDPRREDGRPVAHRTQTRITFTLKDQSRP